MKRVQVFNVIKQFEEFINSADISIIDVKVNSCEQSHYFQESFIGVVYYEDAPQGTKEEIFKSPNTASTPLFSVPPNCLCSDCKTDLGSVNCPRRT